MARPIAEAISILNSQTTPWGLQLVGVQTEAGSIRKESLQVFCHNLTPATMESAVFLQQGSQVLWDRRTGVDALDELTSSDTLQKRTDASSSLKSLPDIVIGHILSFLTPRHATPVFMTCKDLSRSAVFPWLWQQWFFREYSMTSDESSFSLDQLESKQIIVSGRLLSQGKISKYPWRSLYVARKSVERLVQQVLTASPSALTSSPSPRISPSPSPSLDTPPRPVRSPSDGGESKAARTSPALRGRSPQIRGLTRAVSNPLPIPSLDETQPTSPSSDASLMPELSLPPHRATSIPSESKGISPAPVTPEGLTPIPSTPIRHPRSSPSLRPAVIAAAAPAPKSTMVFRGHTEIVRCVRFDRSKLAYGAGKFVRLGSLETGRSLGVMKGHSGSVTCLDFNHHLLASGSTDRTIRVFDWDTLDCKHISSRKAGHDDVVTCLKLTTPQGHMAVSGSLDASLKLWDLQAGKCESTINPDDRHKVGAVLALDSITNSQFVTGNSLMNGSDGSWSARVGIWDLRAKTSDSLVAKIEIPSADSVSAVCVQSENNALATGGGDGRMRIFDLRTLAKPITVVASRGLRSINSIHLDRRMLLACQDTALSFYQARHKLTEGEVPFASLVSRVLPQQIATNYGLGVSRWDCFAYHPTGRVLALASPEAVIVWNARAPPVDLHEDIFSLDTTPDAKKRSSPTGASPSPGGGVTSRPTPRPSRQTTSQTRSSPSSNGARRPGSGRGR